MDLGLERAGWECRWQVESDEWKQRVLEKSWPGLPRYGDIRTVQPEALEKVEGIAGGFPCRDISVLGRRAGLSGQHSGLWTEFARVVRAVRPRFVLVENVPSLLVRGMGDVLRDLAAVGYDAEWEVLPAAAFGASHLRARLFILAYPRGFGDRLPENRVFTGRSCPLNGSGWAPEPRMGRVANGIPDQAHRLGGLGDSVCPPVAEWIGRRLLAGLGGG